MKNEFEKLEQKTSFELTDKDPYLSQTFFSLEGEGMTIGRSALFLRINGCNATCTFCDTSFSIKGEEKYNLVNMVSEQFEEFLHKEYDHLEKDQVNSITITGGEPLKNIKQYHAMFKRIFNVFPKVKFVIIETNGTYLQDVNNCIELLKQLRTFINKRIKFTLSISPKLSSQISWKSTGANDKTVYEWYNNVLKNYQDILSGNLDIQMKFIHFDPQHDSINTQLNSSVFNLCEEYNIPKTKILIMPFTPPDPLGKDVVAWTESKNSAARFALANYYRYSPRMHIDRRLD